MPFPPAGITDHEWEATPPGVRALVRLRTTPEALLRLVRDRWSLEGWHWIRDIQLHEDAHRYQGNGAGMTGSLRTAGGIEPVAVGGVSINPLWHAANRPPRIASDRWRGCEFSGLNKAVVHHGIQGRGRGVAVRSSSDGIVAKRRIEQARLRCAGTEPLPQEIIFSNLP